MFKHGYSHNVFLKMVQFIASQHNAANENSNIFSDSAGRDKNPTEQHPMIWHIHYNYSEKYA